MMAWGQALVACRRDDVSLRRLTKLDIRDRVPLTAPVYKNPIQSTLVLYHVILMFRSLRPHVLMHLDATRTVFVSVSSKIYLLCWDVRCYSSV